MHHHVNYLLLGGTARAHHAQLDLHGGELHHRQSLIGCSQKGHAPSLAYGNSGGHIAVEKQLFNAHIIGMKMLNNLGQIIIDFFQAQLRQHVLIRQDGAIEDGAQAVTRHIHQAVATNGRTRVYS